MPLGLSCTTSQLKQRLLADDLISACLAMSDAVLVRWARFLAKMRCKQSQSQGFSSNTASQSNGPDALEETLGRLSKKPGVKATIVLDRATGAVLKTGGQVSSIRKTKVTSSAGATQTTGPFSSSDAGVGPSSQEQNVQELAAMVWNFVGAAGGLVQELDTEVPLHSARAKEMPWRWTRLVTDARRMN
jgi:dynein light chain roadblock-type